MEDSDLTFFVPNISFVTENDLLGAIRLPYLGYLIDSRDFNVS